ncbi:MAG: hypothetical protein U9Q20_00010 [Campylobacterota bacterium]|nr:hypothetical protein [Campylobacterota bacterium]
MIKKQYIFDNPKNVKLLIKALYVCCIILFAMDLVIHRHIYHPWEELIGYYAFYGCISCVVLVLIAREMRKVVMRDENYYDVTNINVNSIEKKAKKETQDNKRESDRIDTNKRRKN